MKYIQRQLISVSFCVGMMALTACANPNNNSDTTKKDVPVTVNIEDNGGIKLPDGFSSNIIADGLGKARHLAVNSNGDVYVKLDKLKDGKGIIILRKGTAAGKYNIVSGFGNYTGTGIALKNGYLYASSNTAVFRYKLDAKGEVENKDKPEMIITGLVDKGEHNSKSIALDNAGNIYVNIGAPSNCCQVQDRVKGSPGQQPCPILEYAGGIWQFKADKMNQSYKEGDRYATGLRNVVGLDWNTATNDLFVMQHGRDQLQDYTDLYTLKQAVELPAECLYELHKGSNCGWPYIYYDPMQNKKILAPEYGGDGKKTGAEDAQDPVVAFPAHMAPNGLLFYTGNQFPEHYKNGAFVAFHGSWNRAPEPQKGYFVAFVPFKNGKPDGQWETFAEGFATSGIDVPSSSDVKYRPCGLAQGPDGSLYITDDMKGTIWKVTYNGKK